MQKEIKVTVIMGVYNQFNRAQLVEAIHSILNQTLKNFEFIIYDDGSEESESNYLMKLSKKDSRIRLFGKHQNNGLAYSLNECIQYARGEFIARMDADDVSLPERLERQVQFLEEHPGYDLVGCAARLIDEDGIAWGVRRMPKEPEKEDFLAFSPFIHPSVMMRKSIFEAGNRYLVSRDTLRCEDYEFFMRLFRLGVRGFNMPEVLFLYREGKTGYQKRRYRYYVSEARIRYRGFRNLEIALPKRLIFSLKPLLVGLLPVTVVAWYHRYKELFHERR